MTPSEHLTRKRALAGLLWPECRGTFDRLSRNARFVQFVKAAPTVPVFRGPHQRSEFFGFLNREVIGGGVVDYLEFGVWEGSSLREWAGLNRHPESRFVGFDSFEGLPQAWNENQRGTFAQTALPQFDDPRISLVKGWFQNTVPGFAAAFKPRGRLIVQVDCDLYSSTLCALAGVDAHMKPGAIVIFDEFNDLLHEFRAFEDYAEAYSREFELLAATERFMRVALELGGPRPRGS